MSLRQIIEADPTLGPLAAAGNFNAVESLLLADHVSEKRTFMVARREIKKLLIGRGKLAQFITPGAGASAAVRTVSYILTDPDFSTMDPGDQLMTAILTALQSEGAITADDANALRQLGTRAAKRWEQLGIAKAPTAHDIREAFRG